MKYLISRSASTITSGLDIVRQTYEAKGFEINYIFGNNEFNIQNIKTSLLPTKLHICEKDKHVGIVERSTYTIR